jgi:hypothetical protein
MNLSIFFAAYWYVPESHTKSEAINSKRELIRPCMLKVVGELLTANRFLTSARFSLTLCPLVTRINYVLDHVCISVSCHVVYCLSCFFVSFLFFSFPLLPPLAVQSISFRISESLLRRITGQYHVRIDENKTSICIFKSQLPSESLMGYTKCDLVQFVRMYPSYIVPLHPDQLHGYTPGRAV